MGTVVLLAWGGGGVCACEGKTKLGGPGGPAGLNGIYDVFGLDRPLDHLRLVDHHV